MIHFQNFEYVKLGANLSYKVNNIINILSFYFLFVFLQYYDPFKYGLS